MKRRDVIMLVGGAAAWPFVARGQQLGRIRRIGVLMGWAESDPASKSLVTTFRDVLSKLGWTEGKNLETNVRWGNGNPARIEAFAKELVELRPDAILGQTT